MPKISVHAGPSNADASLDEVGFVAPSEPEPEVPGEDYAARTILALREIARDRGLSSAGSKAELVARLEAAPP